MTIAIMLIIKKSVTPVMLSFTKELVSQTTSCTVARLPPRSCYFSRSSVDDWMPEATSVVKKSRLISMSPCTRGFARESKKTDSFLFVRCDFTSNPRGKTISRSFLQKVGLIHSASCYSMKNFSQTYVAVASVFRETVWALRRVPIIQK